MNRLFDLIIVIMILPLILIISIAIIPLIYLDTFQNPIYWSKRIGKKNKIFFMPKYRTMFNNPPETATHLLENPEKYISKFGSIIRKLSLDELPQIYSIIKGDMKIVGPRPALYNQKDLMLKRVNLGIDNLLPGITGWAQINGRDEIDINSKVKLDYYYLLNRSVFFDLKIIYLTIRRMFNFKSISH
jgi:O-antigen biosynthesis protein WbqP